jgi:UDP-GlcNAc:undecaprenyl-phosphate GlcNAc-1-phosphate transferase
LVVFIVGAIAAAFVMPLATRVAQRVGALDDTRDPPVPRVGGWAVAFGMVVSLAIVGVLFAPVGSTLLGAGESVGAVALGAAAILILGTIDDIVPLRASLKLAAQILIALGVYGLGVRVGLVSAPGGSLVLGPVGAPILTVLWLVGVSNAFNLLDGADGVATGSAFFSAAAVFLISVALGHPAAGLVAAGLAGALLGFLPFNFPPARAFLGDAGSLFIGFVLAGLAVEASTKGPTMVAIAVPLFAFAVPVLDTTITLVRRVVRGRSPFERDHEHVHHRLQRAGLSPRQVVGVLYVASAIFALTSMLFINPEARSFAVALLVVGTGGWLVSRYLRLHEFNELARVARRGLLQPRAIVMNVELRRAAERLSTAKTLTDLQEGLAILLRRSEFDEVILVVTSGTEMRGSSKAWKLQAGRFVEDWPPRRPDEWEVVCPFEGGGWRGELHLRRRLARRSLLLDLNLMLDIVQPALTQAARQIAPPPSS